MKVVARGAAAGAGIGLLLFVAEGALILGEGAIGLELKDTQGPFAALFAAVRPLLPWLLARVLLAYLAGGALIGALAGALTREVVVKGTKLKWALVFLLEWWVLAGTLALLRAVQRPALFDDLAWLRPVLGWLVAHGEPWHARAFFGVWCAGHVLAILGGDAVPAGTIRWRRTALTLGLVALVVLGIRELRGSGPRHPLTVLIGVDAFRPDRLAAYGGKGGVAPNLEAFARDATIFDRAFTPLAQTEPAWRSLLTARWPPATGVRYPLTAESRWAPLPTFPAALEQAGVHTFWETDCSRFNHLGSSSGFAERRQPPRGAINFALEKLRFRALGVIADHRLGAKLLPEFIDNRALAGIHDPISYAGRLADRMLSAAKSGPTFFAWHATAAHFPGDPVHPFYRQFVRADAPLQRKLRMVFTPIADGAATPNADWKREDSEALYDELLAQADAQVGTLLEALKDNGRYDQATIIVFSDHGESFHPDVPALGGATPVHGARLREEESRIVLMVKPPHSRQVERVGALVRLTDLGPTILELAGAKPLPDADGQSLWPLLAGKPEAPRLLYAETGYTHASPVAFDPTHHAAAPRTFAAYDVLPDGVLQMSQAAHEGVMQEKDFGASDGTHWMIRSPRADGTVRESCDGNCDALGAFLNQVLKPPSASASP